jgi:signal transduction histidine kinase
MASLELRQLYALDPLYTEAVVELLTEGVEGITKENSYPIQLCLNELLQNAFEWSRSQVGCFVLARWYKKTGSVRLAVVDRGIGIPAALRSAQVKGLHRKRDEEVIEAAVTMKHLTSRANQVGGLGLKTVREVVCGAAGRLMVVSLSGKVAWSGPKGILHKYPAAPFRGTAIEIDIRPGGHEPSIGALPEPF